MPATPKRLQRAANRDLTPEDANAYVAAYLSEKAIAEQLTARVNAKKAVLNTFLAEHGSPDSKGSLYFDIEGVDGVSQLKRERRVSTNLDNAKAEAWLKSKGLWDDYSTVIPEHRELDTDAVEGGAYDQRIPKRVFAGFFVESESWALKTVK